MAALPPYEKPDTKPASGQRDNYSRRAVPVRGLQVPSRFGHITSGFRYPIPLMMAGITQAEWSLFTSEIKQHARLSKSQWAITIGGGFCTLFVGGIFITWFALIPAAFVGHHMRKDREHLNMRMAFEYGALNRFLDRWNESLFNPKGLLVRIHIPGTSDGFMAMDISSSKLLSYHQANESFPIASEMLEHASMWDQKDPITADRALKKASRKCRIIILPLDHNQSRSNITRKIQGP